MAACGDDVRLYSSPLIKFSKACTQLVSGRAWYLSGEPICMPLHQCCCRCARHYCRCTAGAAVLLRLPSSCAAAGAYIQIQPSYCPAVRVGYPCFGTPRRVNGKIVGYPAWGRYRVHNL